MIRDFKMRARPFVSFGEITGEEYPQLANTLSNLIEIVACIPVQNTGIVPAENLSIVTAMLATDTEQVLSEMESGVSKLAPNNHHMFKVKFTLPKIPSNLKAGDTYDTKTTLRLRAKYEGLKEHYEWEQQVRIEVEIKLSRGTVYGCLNFIPK